MPPNVLHYSLRVVEITPFVEEFVGEHQGESTRQSELEVGQYHFRAPGNI
jgi:hypothetical protein